MMSFSYQLQLINQSFDQIASWYREFIQRTEQCFQQLHERILVLERQQITHEPTDEQVERVLRKILAEKFADPAVRRLGHQDALKGSDYFVKIPNDLGFANRVDVASLLVSPESVPSQAYTDTFQMLENKLDGYPHFNTEAASQDSTGNVKAEDVGGNAAQGV